MTKSLHFTDFISGTQTCKDQSNKEFGCEMKSVSYATRLSEVSEYVLLIITVTVSVVISLVVLLGQGTVCLNALCLRHIYLLVSLLKWTSDKNGTLGVIISVVCQKTLFCELFLHWLHVISKIKSVWMGWSPVCWTLTLCFDFQLCCSLGVDTECSLTCTSMKRFTTMTVEKKCCLFL